MSQTPTPGMTGQSPTERTSVCWAAAAAAGAGVGELYSDRANCGRAVWFILVSIRKRTCQAEQLCYLGYSPTSPALRQDLRRTLHEHAGEEDPSYQNNSSVPGAWAHTPAVSMGRESLSNPLVSWGHMSTPTPYSLGSHVHPNALPPLPRAQGDILVLVFAGILQGACLTSISF